MTKPVTQSTASEDYVHWDADHVRLRVFDPLGLGDAWSAVRLVASGWSHPGERFCASWCSVLANELENTLGVDFPFVLPFDSRLVWKWKR